MKKVKLKELEDNKVNKLKQYKLDKDSINEFKSKIKNVSIDESNKLAKELTDLIFKEDFNDDYEKVIELIISGANIEKCLYDDCLFYVCLGKKYLKTLFVLLRSGININLPDIQRVTPLMLCAQLGNKEILELLILMGADVNIKNNVGENALSFALKNNYKECADILINAQVHLNCRNINNDSLIDTGESALILVLQDKSIYPVKEENLIADELIKEAENKLNNINSQSSINSLSKIEISLLTREQIEGKNKLKILEKYGIKAAVTDFAVVLGCNLSHLLATFKDTDKEYYRIGRWLTKSLGEFNDKNRVGVVSAYGLMCDSELRLRNMGIRPILPYSFIQKNISNEKLNNYGIKEVEYGEYPQTIIDEKKSQELERLYNKLNLKATGKNYTTDSLELDNKMSFRPRTYTEYEYMGSKYIRVNVYWYCDILANDRRISVGEVCWFKVEPITWLVDEESNIALSKKILVSGVQFSNSNYYDGVFENTFMYQYLNEIFAKDIIPSKNYDVEIEKVVKSDSGKVLINKSIDNLFRRNGN